METGIQSTKARLKSFDIIGYSMKDHVNKLAVYESMFKQYKTCSVRIMDTGNMINNLNLTGGMPVSFSFDGFEDISYDETMYIHSIKGEKNTQNARMKMYDIDLIGKEYYQDKKQIVQRAYKGVPGTQAIAQLHSEFIGGAIRVLAESLGPISLQSHIVRSKKPFTGIKEILDKLNFAQYPSGNPMYFRDKIGHVLAPLEALFQQMQGPTLLVEDTTWGKNWYDIFNSRNAIIQATAEVDYSKNGRSGAADVAGSAYQQKTVFDHMTKTKVVEEGVRQIAGGILNGISSALTGGFLDFSSESGAAPNFWFMDGKHLPAATDQSNGAEESRTNLAAVKNGPGITVRVPIQSGLEHTVGQGMNLKLLPPIGDYRQDRSDLASGTYLVTDLCHELFFDDRRVASTTQMMGVRGGVDA